MAHDFATIAPSILHLRIRDGQPVTLLDVRSPVEYRSGHVRGALSVPLDDFDRLDIAELTGAAGLDGERPLYLTCHSGLRAQQAAERLREAGYHNLVLLQGGTEAWQRSALPMRRCGNDISLERQVQIAVGTLLILKVVFGFTVHELFFVLGALVGAGLIVAGVTRWCGMARLIARLPWNRRSDCIEQATT